MLYVTTRDKYDAYTAPRTLMGDRGPDGGWYLPFRMPTFSSEEIATLRNQSFGQCVAQVLNLFYTVRLTGWDVDFCVGRYPIKIANLSQKVLVAELWRNLDGSYEKLERNLAARICGCGQNEVKVTSWLRIAIRIAVLFGVYAELLRMGVTDEKHPVDIAVDAGDFSLPMAVWYARQMGLPVANIIFSCSDNSDVWDLLHQGQLRMVSGETGELERLIYSTMGVDEVLRFCKVAEEGGIYTLRPGTADLLRKGIFSAVVSKTRQESVISSVYRTNERILTPDAALGYGGLMDYRAKTGAGRCAVLLADSGPESYADRIISALKIAPAELKNKLDPG